MGPRLLGSAELLEALAEREVGVMGGWIELQERLERRPRFIVLAGVVVGPTERLEDRLLAWLRAGRPLQHDRRRGKVPLRQQLVAALEQLVGRLAILVRFIHRLMVPRVVRSGHSSS